MKINIGEIERRVEQGLINKQKHPEFPLWIYNYSQRCQFDRAWDEYTTMCRGLILDEQGNVVALPFKKFFNIEELDGLGLSIPKESFTVTDKWDGSLGISYNWDGKTYLATRGSFVSDQATIGTRMLQDRVTQLQGHFTYLFEIVYPENRIVVNYEGKRGLVLLAAFDTETGEERDITVLKDIFECVGTVDINDLTKIKELEKPNSEGFVIRFNNGFRVKVKFDEYVRLHRIVTGINPRRVWDILRNGDSLDEFMKGVPEEFEKWIKGIRDELMGRKSEIYSQALTVFAELEKLETRKDFALEVMNKYKDISGILFAMKDERDPSDIIWKMIKPVSTETFRVDM
jgi:RNA ligase